jgi:NADPH-ferrihemoprotein reductase
METGQLVVMVVKTFLVLGLVHALLSYRRAKNREGLMKPKAATPGIPIVATGVVNGSEPPEAAKVCGPEAEDVDLSTMPPLTILFASQTGTAESFAARIASDAKMQGFNATLQSVEDLVDEGVEQLAEHTLVVLVAATYGEGEPTDDAIQFHKWLKADEHADDLLKSVNFAVYGLGDRSYEQFCVMGRFLNTRLQELGATQVYESGEGDDAEDIQEHFDAWRMGMWSTLRKHAFGEGTADVAFTVTTAGGTFTFGFQAPSCAGFVGVVGHPADAEAAAPRRESLNPLIDGKVWLEAPVLAKRELHSEESPRACLHVEFDVSAAPLALKTRSRYEPGDHAALLCENDPQLAAALSSRLRCKLSDGFRLEAADPRAAKAFHIPSPCTVRRLLCEYLDISRPPSPQFVLRLAEAAADAQERDQLLWLASREGKADYAEQIAKPEVTLLELLYGFPSVELGLDAVAEYIPRLQPRLYSISSSPRVHPAAVHVTAAVVHYEKPEPVGWLRAALGRHYEGTARHYDGVCTSWLDRLRPRQDRVRLYLRQNPSFRLPPASTRTLLPSPAICIGPGTGLAPFRGFIQDRRASGDTGCTDLYFGCRSA